MIKQALTFAAICAAVASIYIAAQLFVPVSPEKPAEDLEIKEGTSFSQAAGLLKEKGYIRDAALFRMAGRVTGAHKRLRPGFYLVDGDMTPWEVFRLIWKGGLIQTDVTILEGECLAEIKQKLASKKLMAPEDFDRLAKDRSFMESIGIHAPSLEGFLFPDTYRFPKGTSPEKIISTMVKRLLDLYNGELRIRTNELGMNMLSVMTLASIIEKEAMMDHERPLVSAVFHNRLRVGMPLQADPTAVYGVKPPRTLVSSLDLKKKTKYNTYKIRGLPPGPIASPGLKSIRAALYPSDVSYLYFVANYDGTHRFSTSYDDHRKAVQNVKLKLEAQALSNGASAEKKPAPEAEEKP